MRKKTYCQDDATNRGQELQSTCYGETFDIAWALDGRVDVGTKNRAALTNGHVHRDACGFFGLRAKVMCGCDGR